MHKIKFTGQTARFVHKTHLQTIWPNFLRKKISLPLVTKRITLLDDDFLDVSYLKSDRLNNRNSEGIVLVFHGLGGSVNSYYSLALMKAMQINNFEPIFVHFRGASGEPNKQPISYHAGKTDDIAFIINKTHKEYPHKKLFALGISIGGSALLNYMGNFQRNNPLTSAVAVSVPYDLYDAAATLNKGFAKVYQRYLLNCQKSKLKKKFNNMDCPIDLNKALKATNFFEFDEAVTAPLHGFSGAMDYYTQCSARQYLRHIKIPTLLIHSIDDPFMTAKSIPKESELGKTVFMELHKKGGHVGFIEGRWPWEFEYYLDKRIPDFFKTFL